MAVASNSVTFGARTAVNLVSDSDLNEIGGLGADLRPRRSSDWLLGLGLELHCCVVIVILGLGLGLGRLHPRS